MTVSDTGPKGVPSLLLSRPYVRPAASVAHSSTSDRPITRAPEHLTAALVTVAPAVARITITNPP